MDINGVGAAEHAHTRAVQPAGVHRFQAAGAHGQGMIQAILQEDFGKIAARAHRAGQHLPGNVLIQHVMPSFPCGMGRIASIIISYA